MKRSPPNFTVAPHLMEMKERLKSYFNKYVAFDEEEISRFYSCLSLQIFQKKGFLLKEGELCRSQFFITRGLTRSFYIDHKGNEQILQFGIENWWVSNIESFLRDSPSNLYIQALEDTTVLMISKADLERLYSEMPKLERLFRIITENMLIALQRRYGFYMKMGSKERYEFLVKSIPDFVQRVPQYMIASYLEITPEYLSELRNQR